MSLKGVLEFALQIKKFRNIDLFEPGFYNVRFTLYQEVNKKRIYARPYSMTEKNQTDSKEEKSIIRPFILSTVSTYVSKTFSISLTEEELKFNESCCFRIDLDALSKKENTTFYLEVDLMFTDYLKFSELICTDELKLNTFRKVATFRARITNPEQGIHEYMPILFEQRHSCVVDILFHSTLMSVRVQTDLPKPSQPDQKADNKEYLLYLQSMGLRKLLEQRGDVNMEMLDEFYAQSIADLKVSYHRMVDFFAVALRLYMQEPYQTGYLKFLEGTISEEIITEQLKLNRMKENKGIPVYAQHKEENKAFDKLKTKKISEIISSRDPDQIILAIAQEILSISGSTFHIWRSLNEMMLESPRNVLWYLRNNFNEKLKENFKERTFEKVYKTTDIVLCFEQNSGEANNQLATTKRETLSYKPVFASPSIEDCSTFPHHTLQPIVFEEICVKESLVLQQNSEDIFTKIDNNCRKNTYKGVHLIVLCHGFQGSSNDLRLIKNTISYLYPDTIQLCASSNEDLTDEPISKMGVRLATEVRAYIDEWIQDNNLGRLSFIGHSLGGLVIRAALPYLEQYSNKMHLFMTFSTPHLGIMNTANKLIDAGLWLLKQWKRSKSLEEMSLTDAPNIEETYLFKLSNLRGLKWFKHIAFLSSFQDEYSPFDSARIKVTKKTFPDIKKQALYEQMARNILSDISTDCIYRIDVNFPIVERTLDSMLGRAAHIEFLDSNCLAKMLVWKYTDFFA